MPKYLFTYHGGMPETREQAVASLKKWGGWFSNLGRVVVDKGLPARTLRTTSSGPGSSISGYSVITAATENEAVRIAADCPIHGEGGTVAVSELIDL